MLKKIIIGTLAGVVSGLFGAGGGMILVPAFIHLLKIDEKKARATSVFAILPMVLTSGFFYMQADFIDWNLGIKCAIGGTLGRLYRVKITQKIIK